ncbi:hypothetical protein HII31_13191 [Pseudocercospora fuligena]|uniref:Uncharacterized protein n=1 Tax=Pseudocercospora fuligena TaxID=685502 RepID=A0A8H6R6V7_9PEZI|nr:hypothetical protein HII31_13191 [Pseudocercospora fuligena]
MALGRFQEVQFIFSRIDLCKEVHCAQTRNAIVRHQIETMTTTTREYVDWIAKTYDDYALQHLSVRFCGHFDRFDSCWASEPYGIDGNVLTTINQEPIYEALLAPVLKLPVVGNCQISTLHHVSITHATLWNQNFMVCVHWTVMNWLSGSFDKTLNFYVHFLRQWEWTRPGVQYMLPESWYHDRLGMNREEVLRLVDVDVYGSKDPELDFKRQFGLR